MNRLVTKAIVLKRINYGEADRIVTFITPSSGRITALAKAVRKPASKLAGGIEMLSENEITLLAGRGELQTLISSRLVEHYRNIISSMSHLQAAYDILAQTNKVSEYLNEESLYEIVKESLAALNQKASESLVGLWFDVRLLVILGHGLNLTSDTKGAKLTEGIKYHFSVDSMSFTVHKAGVFTSDHIKLLRLCQTQPLEKLAKLNGLELIAKSSQTLASQALRYWL